MARATFSNESLSGCDRFCQIFVQIGAMLAIFRPFEGVDRSSKKFLQQRLLSYHFRPTIDMKKPLSATFKPVFADGRGGSSQGPHPAFNPHIAIGRGKSVPPKRSSRRLHDSAAATANSAVVTADSSVATAVSAVATADSAIATQRILGYTLV